MALGVRTFTLWILSSFLDETTDEWVKGVGTTLDWGPCVRRFEGEVELLRFLNSTQYSFGCARERHVHVMPLHGCFSLRMCIQCHFDTFTRLLLPQKWLFHHAQDIFGGDHHSLAKCTPAHKLALLLRQACLSPISLQ